MAIGTSRHGESKRRCRFSTVVRVESRFYTKHTDMMKAEGQLTAKFNFAARRVQPGAAAQGGSF